MVKIIFHGTLKNICPDVYSVEANTPSEAIRGLTNQFRDKLIRKDGSRFCCSVKECKTDFQLNSKLSTEELNIYPSFCASGGGGSKSTWIQIGIGALIIVAAVLTGPGGFAAAMTAANWGAWSASFAMMGASMMISGMTNLMFGQKFDTAKDSDNPDSSKAFGNQSNTTKIGTRIPIGYGKYKIAGQYLSINTEAVDVLSDVIVTRSFFHKTYTTDKFGVE